MDSCYHCGSTNKVKQAYCEFTIGTSNHCAEHHAVCEQCGKAFCNIVDEDIVVTMDDGFRMCKMCYEDEYIHQEHTSHGSH